MFLKYETALVALKYSIRSTEFSVESTKFRENVISQFEKPKFVSSDLLNG